SVIYIDGSDLAHAEFYTLSLHDALPISLAKACCSPSRSSGRLVSSRHSQWLPPVTWGRQKLTTSWCALSSSSRVVSSLRRHHPRSEEHTSELQSRGNLVCRLLLEKKKSQ